MPRTFSDEFLTPLEQAVEFRQAFNRPTQESRKFTSLVELQTCLIYEEFDEFCDAEFGTEEELKELADLVYVCYQYAAAFGYDLDEALRRVHSSNMSKLGEDGKPIYRADGKVLKGPNYKAPDLSDLI